jgi:hypothetical protein
MKVLLVLAAIGSGLGGLYLVGGMLMAGSAPQEAAAAAFACAFAVVPYVFARAFELWGRADDEKRRHTELLQAINGLRQAVAASSAVSAAATSAVPAAAAPTPRKTGERGVCPNCQHVNDMGSDECENCRAHFGSASGSWKLKPL